MDDFHKESKLDFTRNDVGYPKFINIRHRGDWKKLLRKKARMKLKERMQENEQERTENVPPENG